MSLGEKIKNIFYECVSLGENEELVWVLVKMNELKREWVKMRVYELWRGYWRVKKEEIEWNNMIDESVKEKKKEEKGW